MSEFSEKFEQYIGWISIMAGHRKWSEIKKRATVSAYTGFSTRQTSQGEAIPGQQQVVNSAGGFVYQLDDWKAFERFLIMGSEGGTYYVGEKKLTKENALRSIKVIEEEGRKSVELIVGVSDSGRAVKNDPAIFALALAASTRDPNTRAFALVQLPKVCRTPTHLFHFVTYVKQFRGLGRGLRRALALWYNDMPVDKLAYEVVKYQQRDGWSNADVLRLAHPFTNDEARSFVYKWIVDGYEEAGKKYATDFCPQIIHAFEGAKVEAARDKLLSIAELCRLITRYNLSREMLPTEALTHPEVWEALLEKMPYTAMIRNLGNMSKVGLLKPMSESSKLVVERLHDETALRKARIHPLSVLIAMKTYSQGKGVKGSGEWTAVPNVVSALDDAFYLAFKLMEPTGKRLLFGVDVSGSMSSPVMNLPISCAEGAAAMALACAKSEREYYIMGFTSGPSQGYSTSFYNDRQNLNGFRDLGITANMSLNEALQRTSNQNFGATDCALSMLWAIENKVKVDAFLIITDNETWAGTIHPNQALRKYREQSGVNAKQVVIGMTATEFTIADPNDAGTLDVAGFSTDVPQVISEFLRG